MSKKSSAKSESTTAAGKKVKKKSPGVVADRNLPFGRLDSRKKLSTWCFLNGDDIAQVVKALDEGDDIVVVYIDAEVFKEYCYPAQLTTIHGRVKSVSDDRTFAEIEYRDVPGVKGTHTARLPNKDDPVSIYEITLIKAKGDKPARVWLHV